MPASEVSAHQWRALTRAAQAVRRRAYAPYSRFRVGAALLDATGRVWTGCNVENASFGLTICAERSAVTAAVAGGARRFRAMVVITPDGGSLCGACRQVLAEFAPTMPVRIVSPRGKVKETTVAQLLPDRFEGQGLR